MSVELSKQKLDIDDAARAIHIQIQRLQEKEKILLTGIKALENSEDMLNGTSVLAQEVRNIMRDMFRGDIIPK